MADTQTDSRKAEMVGLYEELTRSRRLIILSNRGPVEHQITANGQVHSRRGTGGVVTALSTLMQSIDFTWVASAMGEGDRKVSESAEDASIPSPISGQSLSLRYVVTPRRVYHKYYNVFCNPLLWFLQHYMWSSPYTPNVDSSVHDAWENGYVAVNKAFADAVISDAQSYDRLPCVVVHDYHLYLVPMYVRQALPNATIANFIHVPWPSPAYWLLIPSYIRTAICRALCQSDIVGFQCTRDVHAFLDSCEEFLPDAEVDHAEKTIQLDGQRVRARVYPLSIDPEELRRIAESPRSLDYERRLKALCLDHTIVRVDRLEPSKNVVRGFKAYQLLLERYPELHNKVTFLAFLAPSRTRVRQYQRYAEEVDQQVQEVNKTYGTNTWTPIHTFYENNYTQAIAGLRLYDVLMVNSVIDGMNLVAKEGPGVNTREGMIVLSEAVGAYDQLRKGALAISPTDIEGTMQAIHKAITMPSQERHDRAASLAEVVEREDVTHWLRIQAEDMLSL
jgi:trehalose 6-phosphate synthase